MTDLTDRWLKIRVRTTKYNFFHLLITSKADHVHSYFYIDTLFLKDERFLSVLTIFPLSSHTTRENHLKTQPLQVVLKKSLFFNKKFRFLATILMFFNASKIKNFTVDSQTVVDPIHCTPSLLTELYAAACSRANCTGDILSAEWIMV